MAIGERAALLVSAGEYSDPTLTQLRATRTDAERLARLIADPNIGGYTTTVSHDLPYHEVSIQIGRFFKSRVPEDHLLLYFSGHGIKNDHGELFLASADTRLSDLEETSIAAARISRQIERCRAKTIIVLLDCCYSGAFPLQMDIKGADAVNVAEIAGDGCVVIAGSSAIEYAFEGPSLESRTPAPSIFTAAVLEGVATGSADLDQDGVVSTQDLFDYVMDSVRVAGVPQTPTMTVRRMHGKVVFTKVAEAPRSQQQQRTSPRVLEPMPTVSLVESLVPYIDHLEAVASRSSIESTSYVPFGLYDLDEATGGLNIGELALVTGPRAVGKSAFLNGVLRCNLKPASACFYASLEHSRDDLLNQLVSAETQIPLGYLRNGTMSDQDWSRLAATMPSLSRHDNLEILVDQPTSVDSLLSTVSGFPLTRLLLIDNLQLVSGDSPNQLLAATRALRIYARAHDMAVLASVVAEQGLVAESRSIGLIDRYADMVLELSRPDLADAESDRLGEADIRVVRNRRGVNRLVTCAFQPHYARFVDWPR